MSRGRFGSGADLSDYHKVHVLQVATNHADITIDRDDF